MRVALVELRRRPGRFAPAVIALLLLTVLLLMLGGLLDGLYNGSTGALRAQPGQLLTYSADAKLSVVRSRIDAATTAEVSAVAGVQQVGGLGTALLGAQVPGRSTEASVALFGYQIPPTGVPAPPAKLGDVYADTSLKAYGVKQGQTLLIGPRRYAVVVIGWVTDTNFLLQGGLWGNVETWRAALASARPDQVLAPGTYQVLTVVTRPGADPTEVAAAIDRATHGTTRTVTRAAAVNALPGIEQQRSTFNAIIYTTFLVAALVVALFFALLTLERLGMYAVFKALGRVQPPDLHPGGGPSRRHRRARLRGGRGAGLRRPGRHPAGGAAAAHLEPGRPGRDRPGRHVRARVGAVSAPRRPHRSRNRHRLRPGAHDCAATRQRPQVLPIRGRRHRGRGRRHPRGG